MTVTFREASPAELEAWDDLTVHPGGGHVYQSMAWAEHRQRLGWRPWFLVGSDSSAVLALGRSWPWIGGASAYLPRGPIPAGGVEAMTARVVGAATWLADRGIDVVASDAEVPAATGYPEALRGVGFRPIPDIQPSRHRLSLALPAPADEDAIRAAFARSTRQRITAAERADIHVLRHDRAAGGLDDPTFEAPDRPVDVALDEFHALVQATGERLGFRLGPGGDFVGWWLAAHAAGHVILLEARSEGATLAALLLYRHGGRLSTVHSADVATDRGAHPGVMHLLRWRAIQLAIREGRTEMDLGGVDVGPDHREPSEGRPTFGLYQHKRSFGATWVEMTGAHERIFRPRRYAAGRAASRVRRLVRR